MYEFSVGFITGVSLGLEFLGDDVDENLIGGVVIDFFIARFMLLKWASAEE